MVDKPLSLDQSMEADNCKCEPLLCSVNCTNLNSWPKPNIPSVIDTTTSSLNTFVLTCYQILIYYNRTFKPECKAVIKIKLPEDKQALKVKKMMLDNNHDVNPKVFMNLF